MDAAGFPNGRRVFDDVTTIELRALAGATYLGGPDTGLGGSRHGTDTTKVIGGATLAGAAILAGATALRYQARPSTPAGPDAHSDDRATVAP